MTAFDFWQSVANTPFWTYLFFLYLLALSYRTTQPQIVSYKVMKLAPLGTIILTVICMLAFLHINTTNLGYFAAMLTAGLGTGWVQYRIKNVKAIENSNTLRIPGTYMFVLFICAGFFVKFYYGYNPSYIEVNETLTTIADTQSDRVMALLGLLCGLMTGRSIYAKKVLREGPYYLPA